MLDVLNRELFAVKPYKAKQLLFTCSEGYSSFNTHYLLLDNGLLMKVRTKGNTVVEFGEPSSAEVLIIDRLTDILRSLGKKVKVSRFLKCDGGAVIKFYHFLTSTGRRMIVCTDAGFLRSILVQVDPKRRFTWLINGQPGTNMRCLFMDFYCEQRIPFNFGYLLGG